MSREHQEFYKNYSKYRKIILHLYLKSKVITNLNYKSEIILLYHFRKYSAITKYSILICSIWMVSRDNCV